MLFIFCSLGFLFAFYALCLIQHNSTYAQFTFCVGDTNCRFWSRPGREWASLLQTRRGTRQQILHWWKRSLYENIALCYVIIICLLIDGTVWTLSKLDYEDKNFYNVTVIAYDKGTPSLSSVAKLWVTVADTRYSSIFSLWSFLITAFTVMRCLTLPRQSTR